MMINLEEKDAETIDSAIDGLKNKIDAGVTKAAAKERHPYTLSQIRSVLNRMNSLN